MTHFLYRASKNGNISHVNFEYFDITDAGFNVCKLGKEALLIL